jgi:dTDP-4-amino-4,6-dideoxygalactose transaminase
MTALLLDLEPGDEVIVPSFTFVSTANAYALHNAKIVFIDIADDTLNMDHNLLESVITPKTKIIVPVHYAGVGCEMETIMKIAQNYNLQVVEDNSHGFLGKYKKTPLGTFGCMSTLSFHETKNFICGEGGALLINDPQFIERAEIIREKGTNRSQLFRGEVNKYSWVDIGSSYLPSDILAAYLYAQFENKDRIQTHRKNIWQYYHDNLKDWASNNNIRLPLVPDYCTQPYHMFYLLMPTRNDRDRFIEHLKSHSIQAVFHYLPLHLSKMGKKLGYKAGDLPVTEDISQRLVRLPFHNRLEKDDQNRVIEKIHDFYR